MRAYSVDLRERIVTAVQNGQTRQSVAQRFAVSPLTVRRYLQQHQQNDGDLTPRSAPGGVRRVPGSLLPEIEKHLAQNPGTTVEKVRVWLQKTHYRPTL